MVASLRAKGKKTSDGLLSSEDLKEEKVITTPVVSIRLFWSSQQVSNQFYVTGG
jgi:hypothetical protein